MAMGPKLGKKATKALPSEGSPMLQSGVENQNGSTNGQICYISPTVRGVPDDLERRTKSAVPQKETHWVHDTYHLGDLLRLRAEDKIESDAQVGKSGR